jgi:hypothetical protein
MRLADLQRYKLARLVKLIHQCSSSPTQNNDKHCCDDSVPLHGLLAAAALTGCAGGSLPL